MTVLRVDGLSVSFKTRRDDIEAVRDVSFNVDAGETLAIVGESGSGKTTTAAAINRLLPTNGRIAGGEIWFGERELTRMPEAQLRSIRGAAIALVPQDPMSNLDPVMRVGDQIAEGLEVHGMATGRAARTRVVELLEMVGIPDPERRALQYPHEFSGGMRQRALIAMALSCRPQLLIADEPTSALDVTVQRRILDRLDELTDAMGTSVVLITHDLGLAAERADRVAVMRRGEIVEAGAATEILNSPQHEYTKALLQAAPSLTTVSIATRPAEPEPEEPGAPLVEVEGLVKRFPIRERWRTQSTELVAVDHISFEIQRGATVSIVGESGSGKSTTANLLLGLEPPTEGTIRFDGTDVAAMNRAELVAFRRRVQPVFQNPYASLDPRYTVAKSIAEPLRVHRVGTKATRQRRAQELLAKVSLPAEMTDRYPHELSGGQRQRVAIARALALEPDLVVLDEPVSALDVIVQAQVLELLASLQAELGLTYLFISHDLAVVRMISHQVHVMQDGRIVESGTPAQIFDAPQTRYTRELLAAIPGSAATLESAE